VNKLKHTFGVTSVLRKAVLTGLPFTAVHNFELIPVSKEMKI
jgi:hypothetical protein